MAAAAGREQQRRKITAEARQHGQAERFLHNRQSYARRANHHQQRKRQGHRQHLPQPECAKDGQIKHAGRSALEDQRVDPLPVPQPPSNGQQNHGKQRRGGKTQLKRKQ